MRYRPYCIPGQHVVQPGFPFQLVRASHTETGWKADPTSGASIVVCTYHLGEVLT